MDHIQHFCGMCSIFRWAWVFLLYFLGQSARPLPAQGADWWATAPLRYGPPPATDPDAQYNPIDAFINAKLRYLGIAALPEADRRTLIRRVTLDLTGLPPTPEEVAEFLADTRPDAYERLVDRLLASPAYGERMATPWLDASRYADTNGYEQDNGRHMWPWRDWVIQAFNRGVPFDHFTIAQMAGDLLPDGTDEDRLATGFHRNHGLNFEGGSISEESRWNYVHDRVHTTAMVWFATTLSCARCHDHKYDAITQEEYYQFAAYFNNIDEEGYAGENGNADPLMKLADPEREHKIFQLRNGLRSIDALLQTKSAAGNQYDRWKKEFLRTGAISRDVIDSPAWHFAFEADQGIRDASGEVTGVVQGATKFCDGVAGDAIRLDGAGRVNLGQIAAFDTNDEFTIACFVRPEMVDFAPIVGKVYYHGYDICWHEGRFLVHLVHRWDGHYLAVRTQESFPAGRWMHLAVRYDGSARASGVAIYVDGRAVPVEILADSLDGSFASETDLFLGARSDQTPECFRGSIDELRVYDRVLSGLEILSLAEAEWPFSPGARSSLRLQDEELLREHFVLRVDEAGEVLRSRRRELLEEIRKAYNDWPTVMVLAEREEKRPTHVLERGRYDRPGKAVQPGVPRAWLGKNPVELPDRLALAQWMVSPQNPLTARVIAHRQWELFFGRGLVPTTDDFGSQGEPPTHPELLDWLAWQLQCEGWDLKRLHRLIVTSAAYRRSSRATPELRAADPENRYYSRQVVRRLPAETLRDAALAATGLLDRRMGGPGVHPYQPNGLWSELSFQGEYSAQNYAVSEGGDRYRRSLYTYWKRTCPPPFLSLFDAPDREVCQVTRRTTATPLQALALMNDPTFLEAAGTLAMRLLKEVPDPKVRLRHLFEHVLNRPPATDEEKLVGDLLDEAGSWYQSHPEEAEALVEQCSATGVSPPDVCSWAAWTVAIHSVLVSPEAMLRP
ncbi:MAG: hypothetical protein KatS3mg110_2516 [Pirellulaceae bacterium]|nr:MAG: hypothetical protein KatS3mg110_2516 [Pirellulaceae bacterium]